ncbi:hypothetical protein MWH28_06535 [Natroniella sulfidigena]|uniref:hypothetical protein n=1 Tax=Natroniella sulfidigena TaxID=723921 RepID=UPI00200B32B9|nr:hypothetical protein [Natroniella sulfidigena]MCK8817028.1 hypothetical protein [Natroniella sulfidigena]
MNSLLIAMVVSLLAFTINRQLVIKFGNETMFYLIPLVEEILKSGGFYLLGGNLVIIHLGFGIIEGIFDYLDSTLAAILAVISHLIFGYLTLVIFEQTGELLLAILMVGLVHSYWNYKIGGIVEWN